MLMASSATSHSVTDDAPRPVGNIEPDLEQTVGAPMSCENVLARQTVS